MGGSEATYTVEECIPLMADILENNHGKPGFRCVDRFDETIPRWTGIVDQQRRCCRDIY